MAGKPARPARPKAREPAKPKGGRGEVRVATTIRVSSEIFEILSDAALAREIANVAKAVHGQKVKRRDRNQCVAAVIEELIERHRDELETEGGTVRSSRSRRKAMEMKRRKQREKARQRPQAIS